MNCTLKEAAGTYGIVPQARGPHCAAGTAAGPGPATGHAATLPTKSRHLTVSCFSDCCTSTQANANLQPLWLRRRRCRCVTGSEVVVTSSEHATAATPKTRALVPKQLLPAPGYNLAYTLQCSWLRRRPCAGAFTTIPTVQPPVMRMAPPEEPKSALRPLAVPYTTPLSPRVIAHHYMPSGPAHKSPPFPGRLLSQPPCTYNRNAGCTHDTPSRLLCERPAPPLG